MDVHCIHVSGAPENMLEGNLRHDELQLAGATSGKRDCHVLIICTMSVEVHTCM